MNTVLAYLMMVVVLALVVRSMDRLTDLAASAGRLRPGTVRILRRAPLVAFGLWVASLLLRRAFLAEAATLWPFELAVAAAIWLCWIAIVALVVALHDAGARLVGRRHDADAGTSAAGLPSDPALRNPEPR